MDYKKFYEQTLVENKDLKDFSNWENHPALKYKVVLDEDYYLALEEQLKQKDEWFEEINSICGVDKEEPAVESVRDTIQELKDNQLTEESAIDYVYQHTSDYEDWVMGSDIYLELKKEIESRKSLCDHFENLNKKHFEEKEFLKKQLLILEEEEKED